MDSAGNIFKTCSCCVRTVNLETDSDSADCAAEWGSQMFPCLDSSDRMADWPLMLVESNLESLIDHPDCCSGIAALDSVQALVREVATLEPDLVVPDTKLAIDTVAKWELFQRGFRPN